jgi:putative sterol carrier protein
MDLAQTAERLKEKMAFAPHIKAKVVFDFGDEGTIYIDSTQSPAEISNDNPDDADVRLITSLSTFEGFLNGSKDPNIAFMMGQLKVKGSMSLALKLNAVLED